MVEGKHTLPSRNHKRPIIQQVFFHIIWEGKYNTGEKKRKKKENEFSNLLLLANKELNKNNSF